MKKTYTITLDDAVWQRLEDMAREQGKEYHGRLSRAAVIEQLVEEATRSAVPVVQAPVPHWLKLADIVAEWPMAEQKRWQQDEWKAGAWVKKFLDTINAGL